MKVGNLNVKNSESIYVVLINDVCDSIQGYYTTIEEAIKKANEEYELLNKKYTIEVQELIWNEEEEEYINIWNNDNSLNEDSIKLVLGAI